MKCRCVECGPLVGMDKKTIRKDMLYYAEKSIYLCRYCRHKVILKELERLLNDQ